MEEEGAAVRRRERDEEQRDWRGGLPLRWVCAGDCEMDRESAEIEREMDRCERDGQGLCARCYVVSFRHPMVLKNEPRREIARPKFYTFRDEIISSWIILKGFCDYIFLSQISLIKYGVNGLPIKRIRRQINSFIGKTLPPLHGANSIFWRQTFLRQYLATIENYRR